MRRTPLRRETALGRAARHRMAEAGARARGRPAASIAEWRQIRERVLERAGWCCQACGSWRRLDVHHIVKRSRGGSDFDLDHLAALCRACHERTDAPYAAGRLIVSALGGGAFRFEIIHKPDKFRGTSSRAASDAP